MLALSIFSMGIVAVFKTFTISLDRINHLTNRLYVTTLLDNRIFEVNRMLRVYDALPFDLNHSVTLDVGNQKLTFKQDMILKEVEDFSDVFEMSLSFTWMEAERKRTLSRSSYICHFWPKEKSS